MTPTHIHQTSNVPLSYLPHIASNKFPDLFSSANDCILSYLYASEVERFNGIPEDTHKSINLPVKTIIKINK